MREKNVLGGVSGGLWRLLAAKKTKMMVPVGFLAASWVRLGAPLGPSWVQLEYGKRGKSLLFVGFSNFFVLSAFMQY